MAKKVWIYRPNEKEKEELTKIHDLIEKKDSIENIENLYAELETVSPEKMVLIGIEKNRPDIVKTFTENYKANFNNPINTRNFMTLFEITIEEAAKQRITLEEDSRSQKRKEALERIPYLIEHGANVNYKNELGVSVLEKAVKEQEYEIAGILIEHNADTSKLTLEDKLRMAIKENNLELAEYYLKETEVNANYGIKEAVDDLNLDAIKLLKEYGADMDFEFKSAYKEKTQTLETKKRTLEFANSYTSEQKEEYEKNMDSLLAIKEYVDTTNYYDNNPAFKKVHDATEKIKGLFTSIKESFKEKGANAEEQIFIQENLDNPKELILLGMCEYGRDIKGPKEFERKFGIEFPGNAEEFDIIRRNIKVDNLDKAETLINEVFEKEALKEQEIKIELDF